LSRLSLDAREGDAGGPVFDATGAVVGMLLPRPESGPRLPDGVHFAASAGALRAALVSAGLSPRGAGPASALAPEELTDLGTGMTVLVSCWD
ncbi:MAG: peptidoglycan-binding protein, partial [Rhodosalinus sp.]